MHFQTAAHQCCAPRASAASPTVGTGRGASHSSKSCERAATFGMRVVRCALTATPSIMHSDRRLPLAHRTLALQTISPLNGTTPSTRRSQSSSRKCTAAPSSDAATQSTIAAKRSAYQALQRPVADPAPQGSSPRQISRELSRSPGTHARNPRAAGKVLRGETASAVVGARRPPVARLHRANRLRCFPNPSYNIRSKRQETQFAFSQKDEGSRRDRPYSSLLGTAALLFPLRRARDWRMEAGHSLATTGISFLFPLCVASPRLSISRPDAWKRS